MSMNRPNLADAFNSPRNTPDRAAGLTGLLPPTRRPEPAPTDQVTEPQTSTPAVAAPATPRTPARREAKPARTATPVSETADTAANVAVYLEPDLLDTARTARRARETTYDELVVDAFAAVSDHDLQAALHPAPAALSTSGMPTRQRRPRGTAGIQIQLRLTGPQRSWLDSKRADLDAPSRSALVATALKLYLTAN